MAAAAGTMQIYRYFKAQRFLHKDERTCLTSSTSKSKIGRNDPCPCGSGKKFKQCLWKDHAPLDIRSDGAERF